MNRDVFDAHLRKLNLTWPASCEQIRAAHHEQVLAWHPDRFTSAAQKARAEEKMKGINAAFDALTALAKAGMVLCGRCRNLRPASGCVRCGARAQGRNGPADAAEAKRRRVAEAEARIAAARERSQQSEVTQTHAYHTGKARLSSVSYVIGFVVSGLLVRVLWMTSCSAQEPASAYEQPRYQTPAAPVYRAGPTDVERIERRDTKTTRVGAKRGRARSTARPCPAGWSRRGDAINCTLDEVAGTPVPTGGEPAPDPNSAPALEAERRGSNQVGNLLQRGDCAGAQALFRQLRAAGVEGSSQTHFSSDWCPCPP